jgi:hypothetical protein
MGHRFRLFSYEEILVPEGVELADAGCIIKRHDMFEFENSITPFSDLFRYELLHKLGGWWVDADILCLRSDMPPIQHAWAEENDGSICNAVLKFPAADHRLQNILIDARSRVSAIASRFETSDLVTTHLQREPGIVALNAFYPIHWAESFLVLLPTATELVKERSKNSLFIHFWNGMLGYCAPTLIKRPPPDCYLDAVYERYLPGYRRPASFTAFRTELDQFKRYNEPPHIKDYFLKVRGDINRFPFERHRMNALEYWLRCLRHSLRRGGSAEVVHRHMLSSD